MSDDVELEGSEVGDVSHKPRGTEDAVAKQLKLEQEAKALQSALNDGVISNVKTKVAWVLNQFPHTRNSDIALSLKYWELFHPDKYNPVAMRPTDLFYLERSTNITRVRAKIQNEYNLFPADESVRRRRRVIEDDVKEAVVEDKPERNLIFVFADETGKTGDFVFVAAVWILTGIALVRLTHAIRSWQDTSPWARGEMHFSEFRRDQMEALRNYLHIVRSHRQFLSFKTIGIERATTRRPIDDVVHRLHEFMLVRGAEQEIANNRIKLPHQVRLTVDQEQSLDPIACKDIRDRIAMAYGRSYGDQLRMDEVTAVFSHTSQMVQLADVVAGAVNRRRNHRGEWNFKDDMAELIIEQLDLQLEQGEIPEVDGNVWLKL